MIDNPLKLKLFEQIGPVPDFAGALCAEEGMDPETWFIDDAMTSRVAKSYCYLCPFGPGPDGDDACYTTAIRVEEQTGYFAYGIYGGRDAAYRQSILDRKKIRSQEGVDEPAEEWNQ